MSVDIAPSKANFEAVLQKADSGDASAQYQVALYFFKGPEKNYKKSFEWLQKASPKDVDATALLAQFYQCSYEVVPIDLPKSVDLYTKAADKGNAEAQISLALCYRDGDGVHPNKDLFEHYIQKAVGHGHPYAILNVNRATDKKLTEEEVKKIMPQLEEKANSGDPNTMFRLAVCYTHGKGVGQDYPNAIKWLEKAVSEGHVLAMNNLGMRYIKGEGVKKDVVKAVELFRKAASQNSPNAYDNIAIRYLKGEAVPASNELAIEYFMKAARLGNVQAQINLGDSYRNGDRLKKNLKKAKAWYEMAAASGNQYSQQQIDSANFKTDLQKEIEDANRRWTTIRLFFIASRKQKIDDSPVSTLPVEMLKIIVRYANL